MALREQTIHAHLSRWSPQFEARGKTDWHRFLYHSTHITNAVKILASGQLKCRRDLSSDQFVDIASSQVIGQTRRERLGYARLYFRPRTPTDYHKEGFRPRGIDVPFPDAHCPIPIFFLFDLKSVLELPDVKFSDGNLGSDNSSVGETDDFFKSINFPEVYHFGYYDPNNPENENITHHRCAEVLAKDQLSLVPHLAYIGCRSVPERTTLLSLLPESSREQWSEKIELRPSIYVIKEWTHLQEVIYANGWIMMRFKPFVADHTRFNFEFEYKYADGETYSLNETVELSENNFSLRYPLPRFESGVAKLHIDGNIGFLGRINVSSTVRY